MTGKELIDLLSLSYRRSHLVGTLENGVIAALDMEGRLFTILNGNVVSRLVPSAITNRSNKNVFLNPGGDTLWPAPEGTTLGYEYTTDNWRVPPAITGAVWEVISEDKNQSVIRAEVDLINNLQVGIPCEFERTIEINQQDEVFVQKVTETIRYIGKNTLQKGQFLLAPWSLCQFDSGENGKVVMPPPKGSDIWDMYESSDSQRCLKNGMYVVDTNTEKRFQLGLGADVPWIEYVLKDRFRVKRYVGKLPENQFYIDIADAPPSKLPLNKGVKLSIYCDPTGFMEIEACGGCPVELKPGAELSVEVTTEFRAY